MRRVSPFVVKPCRMRYVHLAVNNVYERHGYEDSRFLTRRRSLLWFLGDNFWWPPPSKFSCQWLREKISKIMVSNTMPNMRFLHAFVFHRSLFKTCHMRNVHLVVNNVSTWQEYEDPRISTRGGSLLWFWETPFCDHHLESSVANDWGKNIRDHGVKHYAEHEGPPCPTFHGVLSNHVIWGVCTYYCVQCFQMGRIWGP